jgi:hypothetical protein
VDCQRAFKSFLFPREMSVVLFFVSSAIQKWTVENAWSCQLFPPAGILSFETSVYRRMKTWWLDS